MDRRFFLKQLIATAAASSAFSADARSKRPELVATSITERLTLISGAGGNVTLFHSPDGVLMVDGGRPERSADVLRMVQKIADSDRVHTLFNSHWHWDQTGSNATLGRKGTRIVSHENTRLWLGTDVECRWRKQRFERLPKEALPTETFYASGNMSLGGERIEYGHLPQAHTDGDIYVFFRNSNVLVVGDVVSVGAYPIFDYSTGGWIGGMVDATKILLDLADERTKIIPGGGPVQSRAELQAQHEMLAAMKQRLSKLLAQGMSVPDMIEAAPTREFDGRWGDPSLFIATAWPGLVHRSRELGVSIV